MRRINRIVIAMLFVASGCSDASGMMDKPVNEQVQMGIPFDASLHIPVNHEPMLQVIPEVITETVQVEPEPEPVMLSEAEQEWVTRTDLVWSLTARYGFSDEVSIAIANSPFPNKALSALVKVIQCESGGRVSANRGGWDGDHGLTQINYIHKNGVVAEMGYGMSQMTEALPNLIVAHRLWSTSGWRPWYMTQGCHGLLR